MTKNSYQVYKVKERKNRDMLDNYYQSSDPYLRMEEAKTRFEEIGYNFGFQAADPKRTEGYFYVYRCLKEKLDFKGPTVNVLATDDEIRLTELEGSLNSRERIRIFNNDITGYYKFDHFAKFVVIRIESYRKEKTGFWFISFDRTGQLEAFCDYLNWIFDPEYDPRMMGEVNDSGSYFSRHGYDYSSRTSESTLLHRIPQSNSFYGSGSGRYSESEVESFDSPSVREADKNYRQKINRNIFNQLVNRRRALR